MKDEGHGGHWECVTDLDSLVQKTLPYLLEHGKLEDTEAVNAIFFDNTASTEQLFSLALDNNLSALALIANNQDKQVNEFVSGYPFVKEGAELSLKITQIEEWDNKFEAILTAETVDGQELSFFDTKYYKNKEKYAVSDFYKFTISAFAYNIEVLKERTFSFEGKKAIDWLEKIGEKPKLDTEGNIEPIEFDLSNLVAFLPNCDYKDDAEFQSPIEHIEIDEIFQNKFYTFKIFLFREPDILINLYAKKSFFHTPPMIGNPLRGYIWLQGYLSDGNIESNNSVLDSNE